MNNGCFCIGKHPYYSISDEYSYKWRYVENFFEFYTNIDKKTFMAEYQQRSFLTGKEITFVKEEKTVKGVVESIDNNANLVVKTGNEIQKLSHGEIQIVGMEQLLI